MRAMLAGSDPGTLDTVAARWAAVDLALQQAQEDLLHHTRAATAHWTGTAADAFTARATQLHQAIGDGAAYASHASSGVSYAAEALRAARVDMPPEPASLEGVLTSEQALTTGAPADALHEQQRRHAVAVMKQLEQRYAAAAEMIGTPGTSRINFDRGVFHDDPLQKSQAASQDKSERLENADSFPDDRQGEASHAADSAQATSHQVGGGRESLPSVKYPRFASSGIRENGFEASPQASLDQWWQSSSHNLHAGTTFPQASTSHADLRTPTTSSDPMEIQPIGSNPSIGSDSFAPLPQENRIVLRSSSASQRPRADFSVSTRNPTEGSSRSDFSIDSKPVSSGNSSKDPLQPNPRRGTALGSNGDLQSMPIHAGLERISRRARRQRPPYLTEEPWSWIPPSCANPPVIDK
ncbi:WXG100 family type VII secretion target [Streptacidiphilus anmyonensis]|uniref:WXG100 family type VII secretion target n=1 Tax=Streptacidiphilus anmyonensis TaxID=405782 RepID=UPI00128AF60A|nr:hypothetical protein [Streptacidiphilus anmyonensis]